MSKSLIAGIIATFQITILFIIFLIIYDALGETELGNNPQTQAVLESGKQATTDAYSLWNLAGDIATIIVILGFIFGIIYAVIKIVERESHSGL